MKIAFLLHNAYGIGGTNRTVFNLAAALADRHRVEIVSMTRHRDEPGLALDPRVRLVPLADLRPPRGTGRAGAGSVRAEAADGGVRAESADGCVRAESADGGGQAETAGGDAGAEGPGQPAAPAAPLGERHHGPYSRLAERRIADYLRRCTADVIIGTRPSVNMHLARFGPRGALRIAQEHLSLDAHPERLRRELARHYRALDALITTTEADAAAYRERMPLPGVRVLAVPDSVPRPPGAPSDGTAKLVVAAGKLARGKRFDLLIEAFSAVAAKRPDWRLRIYGGGPEHDRLALLIAGLGLGGHVELMGPHAPIEAEFAKASIAVSASEAESFGVTLIEAMRCGLPVVSTDCPLGPAEIIRDGVDGLLVPTGDGQALASALLDLIGDAPRRRAMAAAALDGSRRFDPAPIARDYERLFAELAATRRRRAVQRGYAAARTRLRAAGRQGARPQGPGAPARERTAAGADGEGPARRTGIGGHGGAGQGGAGHGGDRGVRRGGKGGLGDKGGKRGIGGGAGGRARGAAPTAPALPRAAVLRRALSRAAEPGPAGNRAAVPGWAPPRGSEPWCAAATPVAILGHPVRSGGDPRPSGQVRTARTTRPDSHAAADSAAATAQRRTAARTARAKPRLAVRARGRRSARAAGLAAEWVRVVARLLARVGDGACGRTAADAVLAGRPRLAPSRWGGWSAGSGLCGALANPRFPRPFGGPGDRAWGEPG